MKGLIVAALAAGVFAGAPGRVRAEPAGDAVALLPLDADRSLEIYGQPVASEIARALGAGNVQVVVVGPKTAVPVNRSRTVAGSNVDSRCQRIAQSSHSCGTDSSVSRQGPRR